MYRICLVANPAALILLVSNCTAPPSAPRHPTLPLKNSIMHYVFPVNSKFLVKYFSFKVYNLENWEKRKSPCSEQNIFLINLDKERNKERMHACNIVKSHVMLPLVLVVWLVPRVFSLSSAFLPPIWQQHSLVL